MKRKSMSVDMDARGSADEFAVAPSRCSSCEAHHESTSDTVKASDHATEVLQDEFAYVHAPSGVGATPLLPLLQDSMFAQSVEDEFALPHQSMVLQRNTDDVMSDAEESESTGSSEEECVNSVMDYVFVEEGRHVEPVTEPGAFMSCAKELSSHLRRGPLFHAASLIHMPIPEMLHQAWLGLCSHVLSKSVGSTQTVAELLKNTFYISRARMRRN